MPSSLGMSLSTEPEIIFEAVQGCPKLVDLELPLPSLEDDFATPRWKQLPKNLERLALVAFQSHAYNPESTFEDLECSLRDLIAYKRCGKLPRLQSIVLKDWHPWYGCITNNMSDIRSELAEAGVNLSTEPRSIFSSEFTRSELGWVELQTEPEWVLVEEYDMDED